MGGQRTRGSLMLVLALAALGLALYLHQGSRPQPVQPFTLTTGPAGTTRALLGEILVERLRSDGAPASLVDVDESLTELDMVDSDRVNFAALSGALRIERKAHVRGLASGPVLQTTMNRSPIWPLEMKIFEPLMT